METLTDFIFLGSKITADGDCSPEIKRHLLLGRKAMSNLDSMLKSRDITDKGPSSQSYSFSSSHVWMWELDRKESWVLKNWCFWTVVLEKTLESPLDSKEIKPVNPKGNQSWIFIGRTDAGAEAPMLWPLDVKNWCFWTAVLEKTPESPLDSKEIKPVNSIRKLVLNIHWKHWCWSWSSNILWPSDAKHWLIGHTLMQVKIEGRRIWGWQRMRCLDGIIDLWTSFE